MRFSAAYKLKVKPVLMQELGEYRVTVSASDGMLSTTVSFILSITNTAPYFIDEVPKEFTMAFNSTQRIQIPPFRDDEGNPITKLFESVPSGILDFAVFH
jgi:hypothetical protein